MDKRYLILFVLIFILPFGLLLSDEGIVTGSDDETLRVSDKDIETSKKTPSSNGIDYNGDMSYDGQNETAWCVPNGGVGEWIKYSFDKKSYVQHLPEHKHIIRIYRIVFGNGYRKSKSIFLANNRIKKFQLEYSNGKKEVITLKDEFVEEQVFQVDQLADWVKLTILEVYKGDKYNDTCLSEIDFRTIDERYYHGSNKEK